MISETILRRLVYVKLLHTTSKDRSENGSEIDTMQSILTLDNSFENLFWVILDLKEQTKAEELRRKNYPTFQNLFNEIKQFVNYDLSIAKEMHEARNLIQHSGIMVAKSLVRKFLLFSDEILPKICANVLNVKWEDISLSMLIENKEIAGYYKQGEEHFVKKDYRNAALNFIRAFETAKSQRQLRQFGSLILPDRIESQVAVNKSKSEILEKVQTYVDKIYTDLEVLKLGLDYKQWREYRLPLGSLDPDDDLEAIFPQAPPSTIKSDKPIISDKPLDSDEWDDLVKDAKPIEQQSYQPVKKRGDDSIFSGMSDDDTKIWLSTITPFIIRSILYWQESKGIWDW